MLERQLARPEAAQVERVAERFALLLVEQ